MLTKYGKVKENGIHLQYCVNQQRLYAFNGIHVLTVLPLGGAAGFSSTVLALLAALMAKIRPSDVLIYVPEYKQK